MREMKKIFAGILMTVLLTGCSSQEILSEVPQTIVLPEEQIDSLPMQEEDPTSAETENTESFSLLEEGGSRFAYESLEAPEQIWYLEIEQALGEMEGTVKLSTDPLEQGLDEQDIDKIFQCVMIDHPEIFYATGYTYTKYSRGEKTVGIDFAGSYELTEEEAIVRAEQIRKITADWIRGIGEDKSEYEKVKAVYEQIIFATDYDLNAPDNQNICSVFLEGASVCQGYAKATQYLLNHLGVMCTLVQGTVDTGEAHAWNLVRVDGDYYYVDTTWGDAIDFQALVSNEKVHSVAEIVLVGHEKDAGGVLEQLLEEVQFKAYPSALVDKVEVDVSNMKVGDSIKVKDLTLSSDKDVDVMTDPETTVVTLQYVHNNVPDDDEDEAAAETAE